MERLVAHRRQVAFAGYALIPTRELIRRTILESGCQDTILGRKPTGGAETYASAFERIYQEPLEPKKTRRRAGT